MSNLDLTIAEIMHGDTEVLKIMKGDEQKWPYVSPLPYDAQVEYLSTDGTAYIDTGIVGKNNTTFDISIYLPSEPTNSSLFPFGARKKYTTPNRNTLEFARAKDINKWIWRFGSYEVYQSFGTEAVDGVMNFTNIPDPNVVIFSGVSVTASNNTFDTGMNFYLFTVNNNGTPRQGQSGVRIFSCKLYSSGVLVRDYIPVRVATTGYLYDKVSGTLYGNAAATGAFTYGNDV